MKLHELNIKLSVSVRYANNNEKKRTQSIIHQKNSKNKSLGYKGLFYPCIELLIKNKLIDLNETVFTIDENNIIYGTYKDFKFQAGEYVNELDYKK